MNETIPSQHPVMQLARAAKRNDVKAGNTHFFDANRNGFDLKLQRAFDEEYVRFHPRVHDHWRLN